MRLYVGPVFPCIAPDGDRLVSRARSASRPGRGGGNRHEWLGHCLGTGLGGSGGCCGEGRCPVPRASRGLGDDLLISNRPIFRRSRHVALDRLEPGDRISGRGRFWIADDDPAITVDRRRRHALLLEVARHREQPLRSQGLSPRDRWRGGGTGSNRRGLARLGRGDRGDRGSVCHCRGDRGGTDDRCGGDDRPSHLPSPLVVLGSCATDREAGDPRGMGGLHRGALPGRGRGDNPPAGPELAGTNPAGGAQGRTGKTSVHDFRRYVEKMPMRCAGVRDSRALGIEWSGRGSNPQPQHCEGLVAIGSHDESFVQGPTDPTDGSELK